MARQPWPGTEQAAFRDTTSPKFSDRYEPPTGFMYWDFRRVKEGDTYLNVDGYVQICRNEAWMRYESRHILKELPGTPRPHRPTAIPAADDGEIIIARGRKWIVVDVRQPRRGEYYAFGRHVSRATFNHSGGHGLKIVVEYDESATIEKGEGQMEVEPVKPLLYPRLVLRDAIQRSIDEDEKEFNEERARREKRDADSLEKLRAGIEANLTGILRIVQSKHIMDNFKDAEAFVDWLNEMYPESKAEFKPDPVKQGHVNALTLATNDEIEVPPTSNYYNFIATPEPLPESSSGSSGAGSSS